jgi:hypothetical protein
MKVLVLLLAITAVGACEKKHFCDCHLLRTNTVRSHANFETTHVLKGSRASAEDACVATERSGTDEQGRYVRDCEKPHGKDFHN